MPDGSLNGRAALVTGAGVGIGRAIAESLSEAGACVAVHCHQSVSEAKTVVEGIRDQGGKAIMLQADLADAEQAPTIVQQTVAEFGRLDILINNAGSPIERSRLEDCPLSLWNQSLMTNLTSALLVTQTAIPHLRSSGQGAIVNNITLSVQTGGANGAGPYAIAKGGLLVMTRTLARELAPEVRTNSIMPGVIETRHHEVYSTPQRMQEYRDETPLGRNGTAEEVAGTVLFLVSDAGRFINGALLDINGGRFLR
ncbi:MAG: short-chain dehydrogenase [Planctomycetaceae bacterium]|jgi:3-oxoacyl-[acyl-carrier protein] reductase|nr:short-chain dehydrogenase [Planctomycetaceae bacterium]MBP60617.1 short-chain dehydrogenase [Planctomycetaceae bacterium]